MLVSLLHCVDAVCLPLEDDQELTGTVSLQVEVQDDGPEISGVTLELDGVLLLSAEEAPYDFQWDTAGTNDGTYVLGALAENEDGEEEAVEVSVQVNNCDLDNDGAASVACGGADCDDGNPGVAPGVPDPAGDAIDSNCDGVDGVDLDGDGYASQDSGGGDCDDTDPEIHPCAEDVPGDGVDANCDGEDLESCDDCSPCTADSWFGSQCVHATYPDGSPCDDGDVCTSGDQCQAGVCVFLDATDCDDENPCTSEVCHPEQGCVYEDLDFFTCPGGLCVDGVCCTPDCDGKECGTDGCGGLCGVCQADLNCSFDGQCVGECTIAPFADVAMKINSLEMGSGGYPGMALDLDGDPATCAPEGNCSGGMHNEIGGLFEQITAYVDVNEELQDSLESGAVILLADFEGLNFDGAPFTMRMFTGETVLPQQECDWQVQTCSYMVSHDSFHPSTCESYMQFDNAMIVDGKLTAGGPGYNFYVESPLVDLGATLMLDCHMARVEGDVVVGEDGQVLAMQNLVFGAAVPMQSLFDSIGAMPVDEMPVSPELIENMLDMFLEEDIDIDGDGVNESVSFAVMHDAIPANLVGLTEPDVCAPDCAGKECGFDGCMGTCGTCPAGQACTDDGQCEGQDELTCTEINDCMAACAPDNQACIQDCMNQGSGEAQSQLNGLIQCLIDNGAQQCPPGDTQCQNDIIMEHCMTEYEVCFPAGSLSCSEVFDCMDLCAQMDQACLQGCYSDGTSEAQAQYQAIASCVIEQCGEQPTEECFNAAQQGTCAAVFADCFNLGKPGFASGPNGAPTAKTKTRV